MSLWPTFYYDPSSESFLRHAIKPSQNKNKDDVAGHLKKSNGYYVVSYQNIEYYVHRIIWEIFNSEINNNDVIDHIDGNKLNNHINNLRIVSKANNGRNTRKSSANISGCTGVCRWNCNDYEYQRAFWYDLNGKQHNKVFSIRKYGEDEAFKLASNYRELMIKQLNNEGAQYTERHGK